MIAMAQRHRTWFYRKITTIFVLLVLSLLALGACGTVDVKIEPLVTPTAIPPTPFVAPVTIQAQSAAGLVAYEAPDDSEVVVHEVAMPALVFSSQGAVIEMLPAYIPDRQFLIINTGLGLRLRTKWNALWLTDAYGVGRVSIEVMLKRADESAFQPVESASTADFEAWGAARREEVLDSTLYLPDAGEYDVQVVVSVNAFIPETEFNTEQSYTYQSRVIALYAPEVIPNSADDFTPAFGDLEDRRVLLDWRGWRYGPCYIETADNPNLTQILDEACNTFEGGDWESAANSLQAALGMTEWDVWLQNRLRQQLGTIAAGWGRWNVAVRHFREGLTAALATQDALETAVALHNLGVALLQAGFRDEGEPLLWQSITLREQLEDYPALLLTYTMFAELWDSLGTFEWVVGAMYEFGLPQAEYAESWANELRDAQAEADDES